MLFALFGEYLYFCGVMKGLVIKNTGSCYVVKTEGGECVSCKIKGNFRLRGIRTTNPVAVGDIVEISAAAPDGTAYITSIDTRRKLHNTPCKQPLERITHHSRQHRPGIPYRNHQRA